MGSCQASPGMALLVRGLAAGLLSISVLAVPTQPICQVAEALVSSVDAHLDEWDNQIKIGLNSTLNCSEFLEFTYLSRDRIRMQLEYARGNFSTEEDSAGASSDDSRSTTGAMTHMSAAAVLLSAHLHIHGVLAAGRRECLSEHLQLLFLMSLRRLKALSQAQLRHLWVVLQGTAGLFHRGAATWLGELVDLFEADLRTMESVMVSWTPPASELRAQALATAERDGLPPPPDEPLPAGRPGPPLPAHGAKEPDGVALSTVEVLRRDSFSEWEAPKPLLRALLRNLLPRDSHVADMCAGGGAGAGFLNDTGLLTLYAFDASPNIHLLTRGTVDNARLHEGNLSLWRTFDIVMCLTSASDFGGDAMKWAKVWRNLDVYATHGVVLSCGANGVREKVLAAAVEHAPSLAYDAELPRRLGAAAAEHPDLCAFWRTAAPEGVAATARKHLRDEL